jgi:hypothetical protein
MRQEDVSMHELACPHVVRVPTGQQFIAFYLEWYSSGTAGLANSKCTRGFHVKLKKDVWDDMQEID